MRCTGKEVLLLLREEQEMILTLYSSGKGGKGWGKKTQRKDQVPYLLIIPSASISCLHPCYTISLYTAVWLSMTKGNDASDDL